jgi:hypothetical protein
MTRAKELKLLTKAKIKRQISTNLNKRSINTKKMRKLKEWIVTKEL